jgi:Ca2+-transporting ATPase
MLLMPVHILFLQLIIDPACSIVFEAEALEADAMSAPPRRTGARLFDTTVLARGLWQGAGLLALLLAVYGGARALALPDDGARALTFMVLVLSNLGLIYANRAWASTTLRATPGSNAAFAWITGATIVLLGCVLGIPAIGRLFWFAPLPPLLWLAGAGAAIIGLVWFEGVKWALHVRERPAHS